MNAICIPLVGLALIATCHGFPVIGSVGLNQNDLAAWTTQFMVFGKPVQVGLNWQKDGTITAATSVSASVGDKTFPLSAAISGNLKDTSKFQYEAGAKIDKYVGVVYGDTNGEFKYTVNGWAPLTDSKLGVGGSIEGNKMKPVSIGAGVSYEKEAVQAIVSLDDNLVPSSVNVQIGADPSDI